VSTLYLEPAGVNILLVRSVDVGRIYRGAGPRQRQDERRARLVDAAVEVFGTTGYRSATVERICAAAGLTKRYFYESFDSSEALLLAAYTRSIDELHASMVAGATATVPAGPRGEATAGPGDEGTDLDAMVHGGLVEFFGTIDADPRLARIAFFEVLGVSAEVDAAYQAAIRRFVDTLLTLAEPAFRHSPLPANDREALAEGIVGAVLMIAQHWIVAGRTRPVESVVLSAHTIVTAVLDKLQR
jgi:AcrR family transcriptional regulator